MIGNDIVDLQYQPRNENWKKKRFKEIIFTSDEQTIITNSNNTYTTTWRLWSMKESAYKIYFKDEKNRPYIPKQFVCSLNGVYGSVSYKEFTYATKTTITSDFVFTEAVLNSVQNTSSCFRMKSDSHKTQTKIVKERSVNILSEKLHVNPKRISIQKHPSGTPYVLLDGEPIKLDISLTHHGNWGAISFTA